MKPVRLDGASLTRQQLLAVANGASVELDPVALQAVARASGFLESKVAGGEPLYGISPGFGSNANKLLAGAGTSSYLMLKESYQYQFDEPNPGARERWDSRSSSRFLMNMVNLTIGYERQVLPGFMIGIEPYVKIPIEKIGWCNLKLFSTGASVTMRYTILRKHASVTSRSRGPD